MIFVMQNKYKRKSRNFQFPNVCIAAHLPFQIRNHNWRIATIFSRFSTSFHFQSAWNKIRIHCIWIALTIVSHHRMLPTHLKFASLTLSLSFLYYEIYRYIYICIKYKEISVNACVGDCVHACRNILHMWQTLFRFHSARGWPCVWYEMSKEGRLFNNWQWMWTQLRVSSECDNIYQER